MMFSVSAVGIGALAVSCGVYGPPNTEEIDNQAVTTAVTETVETTEPVTTTTTVDPITLVPDLETLTEDDILTLSDEKVIALAQCCEAERLPKPAYLDFLPDGVEQISDTSAANAVLAQQLTDIRLSGFADMYCQEECTGFWWYFRSDPDSDGYCYDNLVPDAAFVDMKNRLLNGGVNEENVYRLAAMRAVKGSALPFATFVRDEGAMLACTQYMAYYTHGTAGQNDTATLAMHTFWARKDIKTLLNFWDDADKTMRKIEIPAAAQPEPAAE